MELYGQWWMGVEGCVLCCSKFVVVACTLDECCMLLLDAMLHLSFHVLLFGCLCLNSLLTLELALLMPLLVLFCLLGCLLLSLGSQP